MASSNVSISLSVEKGACGSKQAHNELAMVSIHAPEAHLDADRSPIELICVCDTSGSMHGEKMSRMIDTIQFLISNGLQACDRFGIVSFASDVQVDVPLSEMSAAGKKSALERTRALESGGGTNLSGGLLKGIDELFQAPDNSRPGVNPTRALLLFTDGQANEGIRDSKGILNACNGFLKDQQQCSIFTFGFGTSHNEDLLRSIANGTNGLYYYIENSDSIPTAFADCLGGLVSVVAQNASLILSTEPSHSSIQMVHGTYKTEIDSQQSEACISIGDLFSEDQKDILVQLTLPALDEPACRVKVLDAKLRYFSVLTSKMEEITSSITVERPEVEPEVQALQMRIQEQRTRIRVAEAMESASRFADAGQIQQGREVLQDARQYVELLTREDSVLLKDLARDCDDVLLGYEDAVTYRRVGAKRSKMASMSHQQQRSNHTSAQSYSNKSKSLWRTKSYEV